MKEFEYIVKLQVSDIWIDDGFDGYRRHVVEKLGELIGGILPHALLDVELKVNVIPNKGFILLRYERGFPSGSECYDDYDTAFASGEEWQNNYDERTFGIVKCNKSGTEKWGGLR
jgi:hypothetical protein